MYYVQRFGAGEWVRAGTASVEELAQVANRILRTACYREQAEMLAAAIRSESCSVRFNHLLAQRLAPELEELCTVSSARPGSTLLRRHGIVMR